MIKKFLIILLIAPSFCYSQVDIGFKIGSNYPVNAASVNTLRRIGFELGILANKKISKKSSLESNLMFDFYHRNELFRIFSISKPYDGSYYYSDNYSTARLSIYVPLLFKYQPFDNSMTFKGGPSLAGRNLFVFSNSPAVKKGYDPDKKVSFKGNEVVFRTYGMDINFGFSYNLIKRGGIDINLRIPLQKEQVSIINVLFFYKLNDN